MHYRDRGACFQVCVSGGGRIARELFHAANLDYFLTVIFLLSIENVGRRWPRLLFRCPCIFACLGENSQLGINCVCAHD